jgi:hypothetical protein
MRHWVFAAGLLLMPVLSTGALPARAAAAEPPPSMAAIEAYTRYELLAPGSGKFRIIYEVTQDRPGAIYFFNPIRKGSIATDERVTDMATGKPLVFGVVDGAEAAKSGEPGLDPTFQYIRVKLTRPVPADGGEGRILIEKTYEDAKSYFVEGQDIVFDRPLGVKRNSVVLPAGYRLVACNYPSQVLQEPDGRIKISFWNNTPGQAPLLLRARPGRLTAPAPLANPLEERARQTRDIVYFLQQPETHAFDLYHDYTETKAGSALYANVVREGSTVSNPSARNLDTGQVLRQEVLKGDAITRAGLSEHDRPQTVTPASEVVVFRYPALKAGESARLRMSETYTDPNGYTVAGDTFTWRRTLGRAANAVVLPAGWVLTNSSVPAAVTELADGRTRLDFINGRLDEIDVTITGQRVAAAR